MMGAAEDFEVLLALFCALPEERQLKALETFIRACERTRARLGYPRSERIDRVRRYLRTRMDREAT
jgi:hypothetical protein